MYDGDISGMPELCTGVSPLEVRPSYTSKRYYVPTGFTTQKLGGGGGLNHKGRHLT